MNEMAPNRRPARPRPRRPRRRRAVASPRERAPAAHHPDAVVPAVLILGGAYYYLTAAATSRPTMPMSSRTWSRSRPGERADHRGAGQERTAGQARRIAVPHRPAAVPDRARAGRGAARRRPGADDPARHAGGRHRRRHPGAEANLAISRRDSRGSTRCCAGFTTRADHDDALHDVQEARHGSPMRAPRAANAQCRDRAAATSPRSRRRRRRATRRCSTCRAPRCARRSTAMSRPTVSRSARWR